MQAIVFSDCGRLRKFGTWRNNNTEPFFSELAQQYSIEPVVAVQRRQGAAASAAIAARRWSRKKL